MLTSLITLAGSAPSPFRLKDHALFDGGAASGITLKQKTCLITNRLTDLSYTGWLAGTSLKPPRTTSKEIIQGSTPFPPLAQPLPHKLISRATQQNKFTFPLANDTATRPSSCQIPTPPPSPSTGSVLTTHDSQSRRCFGPRSISLLSTAAFGRSTTYTQTT